jgi:anti-anti-sigma factor
MADEKIYELENRGDIAIIITAVNSITHDDNAELKKAFTNLLAAGSKNIVLDLTKTFYVSSIALASLVFMQKTLKEAGGNFVICGVNERVKEILEMTNLDKILDIVNDQQAAVSKLANK